MFSGPELDRENASFCAATLVSAVNRPICLVRRLSIPSVVEVVQKKIRYSSKKSLKKTRVKNPSLKLRNLSQIFTFELREDLEIDSNWYRIFFGRLWMYLERSVVRDHRESALSPRVVS